MANQTATNQFASYKTYNCQAPKKESRVLPLTLDFTNSKNFNVDLGQAQDENQLEFCQGIFFDNSNNAHDVTIVFAVTGQSLILRASKQGYLPTLCPERIQFSAACGSTGGTCPIHLLNFPVPAAVW